MNSTITDNIKNVVVLMLENRSCDHLFGDFPGVDGIQNAQPNLTNPEDPKSTSYGPYPVTVTTQPDFSPGHAFQYMMRDIFGPACIGYCNGSAIPDQPSLPTYYPAQTMCGFVRVNLPDTSAETDPVMSYFQYLPDGDPGRLNVLHTLAENFVLCDNWFCDTPSETVPNRLFVHAATNMGNNDTGTWPGYEYPPQDNEPAEPALYAANTIYQQLDAINPGGTNWAMYGFPQDEYDSGMFAYTASNPQANRSIFDLPVDVLTGNLPFYTFIMPSLLFNTGSRGGSPNGNSMHPDGDVRLGENLLASVYNILRNSPIWQNTLLIVTFDENGGIYDHKQPPPATPPDVYSYYPPPPPPPSPLPPGEPLFDYSMLGPRIPALLISPWLATSSSTRGSYQIDSSQYQNTSILRFVQDLFAAQNESAPVPSVTKRDASAMSFATSQYWLTTASTNCPQIIPLYQGFPNWGTELTDPNGDDPYSGPFIQGLSKTSQTVPPPLALHLAKEYCSGYPGHPDSGKPLTRAFATHAELIAYMQERKMAARAFYRRAGSRS
jgi:phospholipase C